EYQFPFAKYPAIRIALLLAGGIILASYLSLHLTTWLVLLGVMLLIIIALEVWPGNNNLAPFYIIIACYLIATILFGAAWQTLFNKKDKTSTRLLSTYTWQPLTFEGTVQEIARTSSGGVMIDFSIKKTILQDSLIWQESYKLRTYYDSESSLNMERGDKVKFEATIYPLTKIRNPGQFKYKKYLGSQNIFVHAGLESVLLVKANENWLTWNWLRKDVIYLIEQNFGEKTAALAKSILIGHKNELGRDTKAAFSRVGLAHIMAVSGLHVGFILAPFWLIIPFLWTLRYGKHIGFGLMVLLLIIYAGLTGFSTSVIRASIMGGFITFGRLFNKSRNSKNITAIAAIIILLINPSNLFGISFQLSFAAVYIILLILPVIQRIIPKRIQHSWYGIPVMAAIISFVVQAGLYPILSFYFHEFSLIAPLSNAVILPFLALLVPYSLLLVLVAAIFPAAAFWLNTPCRLFLEFLNWFTSTLVHWHWSWIKTPETGFMFFLIWLLIFLFFASVRIHKLRWKVLGLLLLLLVINQGISIRQAFKSPALEITFFDVGQGDASIIATPAGKHFLIDTGRWSPGYNSGEHIILPYLKWAGIKKLDAVFLSHPHADHIGGIAALIGAMPIDVIYNSGTDYDSNLYRHYLKKAADYDIPVRTLGAGDIVRLDPSLELLIYGPLPSNYSSDVNEHSLIMELIYGETAFLFMGDAGKYQEKRLLKNYGALIKTDFLKVGHHGSATGSSKRFLSKAAPIYSVVSVAKKNRYGLPNAKTIQRLKESGTRIYFTAIGGALQFVSNGKTIKQTEWR
ncbi:MAG TPA: DNA internalization-related competence protein ComEC/Rec2, partial [Balneolaceae bacterium]|nr:DNA internalization-related competence protein ComEC/Rec2 [Balneolaceae bacterium]